MSEIEKQPDTNEPKREKVRVVSLQYVDDFPDHPFQVREDEDMEKLIESIRNNGVLNPIIVRKKEDERYDCTQCRHKRTVGCRYRKYYAVCKKTPVFAVGSPLAAVGRIEYLPAIRRYKAEYPQNADNRKSCSIYAVPCAGDLSQEGTVYWQQRHQQEHDHGQPWGTAQRQFLYYGRIGFG